MRRVDLEVDGLSVDALVASSDPGRLVLNFPLDLMKVVEAASGYVIELAPLILAGDRSWSVWHMDLVAVRPVRGAGDVDELQNQGATSDNAASSREKIAPDNVFQH